MRKSSKSFRRRVTSPPDMIQASIFFSGNGCDFCDARSFPAIFPASPSLAYTFPISKNLRLEVYFVLLAIFSRSLFASDRRMWV